MRLVNLTPHVVRLVTEGGSIELPPSGIVARCAEVSEVRGTVEVDGLVVPLVSKRFGAVEGLPDPVPDTLYIASALAARAAAEQGRRDVVSVGDTVRDGEGRIVGACSLCVF